ncbi:MAG: hypothetical protein EPO26_11425 [Chloroflexota bacterium]|nr:MAG: hypothetical protein EPO26_11425 [Chloroflexota bacterium]
MGGAAIVALLVAACAPVGPTATPMPTPFVARPGVAAPPQKPIVVNRGATPTRVAGGFTPRGSKVRVKADYWLLEAPRADAQRLPQIGLVGVGRTWDAKEQTPSGWVRIDAGPFTGWAPLDVIEFVE